MTDIRQVKRELRQKYRALRSEMDPAQKAAEDIAIFRRLSESPMYQKAKVLLCYVSTGIEVDTRRILEQAFADGKSVAVPCCLDENGSMAFYYINSLSELSPATYGLLEPDPHKARIYTDESASVCIVPGFAFDANGYRIGFGKGFYDRFLHRYSGVKIGICYSSCITSRLPHGRHDIAADYIVTPKYIKTIRTEDGYERQ